MDTLEREKQEAKQVSAVKCIRAEDFREGATVLTLLKAEQPFVVRGLPPLAGAYSKTLEIFRHSQLNLFNLLGTSHEGGGEIRDYHELVEAFFRLKIASSQAVNPQAILREYQALFSKYIVASDQLKSENPFSVQVDVSPRSELGQKIVAPAIFPYSSLLQAHFQRFYLNTVLSVSRGDGQTHKRSKNIHAHNYDTFTVFGQAGSQTSVSFFPPAYYLPFKSRLLSSTPGIVLLIPNARLLEESVMAEALVCEDIQAGDIVYTPPLWFHSFHHSGEYLNIANGEFFPTLFSARMERFDAALFGAEGEKLRTHMEALQRYAMART